MADEAAILKQLKKLRHSNVIRLFKYLPECEYTIKNGLKYETVLIIMEYAPNGQLFDILRCGHALSNQIAKIYFKQIISALKAFHKESIVHRDLKPWKYIIR